MSERNKHNEKRIFICPYCKGEFTNQEDLKEHVVICEENPENLYKKYHEIKKNLISERILYRPFRF